jgi:hypothetical protein
LHDVAILICYCNIYSIVDCGEPLLLVERPETSLGNFVNASHDPAAPGSSDRGDSAVPVSRPSGEDQLIVVKSGCEFRLAIGAELQHTLVAEIGCISKVIHVGVSGICAGPVEIFYCDIYTIARILRG